MKHIIRGNDFRIVITLAIADIDTSTLNVSLVSASGRRVPLAWQYASGDADTTQLLAYAEAASLPSATYALELTYLTNSREQRRAMRQAFLRIVEADTTRTDTNALHVGIDSRHVVLADAAPQQPDTYTRAETDALIGDIFTSTELTLPMEGADRMNPPYTQIGGGPWTKWATLPEDFNAEGMEWIILSGDDWRSENSTARCVKIVDGKIYWSAYNRGTSDEIQLRTAVRSVKEYVDKKATAQGPTLMRVKVWQDPETGDDYLADKTYAEIAAQIEAGGKVEVCQVFTGDNGSTEIYTMPLYYFSNIEDSKQAVFILTEAGISQYIAIHEGGVDYWVDENIYEQFDEMSQSISDKSDELQGDISGLQENVRGLQEDISGLNGRIDSLSQELHQSLCDAGYNLQWEQLARLNHLPLAQQTRIYTFTHEQWTARFSGTFPYNIYWCPNPAYALSIPQSDILFTTASPGTPIDSLRFSSIPTDRPVSETSTAGGPYKMDISPDGRYIRIQPNGSPIFDNASLYLKITGVQPLGTETLQNILQRLEALENPQ